MAFVYGYILSNRHLNMEVVCHGRAHRPKMVPTFYGTPYILVGQICLQRYPYLKAARYPIASCIKASSTSLSHVHSTWFHHIHPLVHKHRNQRLLFTVPQKYLHIRSSFHIHVITTFVYPYTARAAGYRLI